jgi:hypothetical protein
MEVINSLLGARMFGFRRFLLGSENFFFILGKIYSAFMRLKEILKILITFLVPLR